MNEVRQTATALGRIVLVVVLGIHHILERIRSAQRVQRVDDRLHRPRRIAGWNDRAAQRVAQRLIPLRGESKAAAGDRRRDLIPALQVLGDRQLPRLARLHLPVDPLQQRRAVGIAALIRTVVLDSANVHHRIEAQPVHESRLQPTRHVVAQILLDLRPAEVEPCMRVVRVAE